MSLQKWYAETHDALADLAAKYGWTCHLRSVASTGSMYFELERAARAPDDTDEDIEDYGLGGCETLRVRLSDHGTAHCSEDISIAREPSGDDHNLEILAARLQRAPTDNMER